MKIVIELLSILSIATKEVKRRRASELAKRKNVTVHCSHNATEVFARKLLGRTDIEDALKRLDSLIQEECQMATAQILKVATEIATAVKDGVLPLAVDQSPVPH